MAKIELHFGGPTTTDEEISVENYAYNWDVSIETAVIRQFRFWINHLSSKKNNDDDTFFELLLFISINQMLRLPKITAGTYRHRGFVLPKMIIHGDCRFDKETGQPIFLKDWHININSEFFELCFYRHSILKKINQMRCQKNLLRISKIHTMRNIFNTPHIIWKVINCRTQCCWKRVSFSSRLGDIHT